MKCRSCGAEIAAKAIVCYKCGAATTDPVFKAPEAPRRMSLSSWIMIAVAVLLFAGFVVYTNLVSPGSPRAFSQIVVAIAVTIVVLRAIVRRRR
jgi:hypothetical protein